MQQTTELPTSSNVETTNNTTTVETRSHNPKAFVSWKVISKYVSIFLNTYCDVKNRSKIIKYKKVPTTDSTTESSNKPI